MKTYYNSPIGTEIKENEEWEICDNGKSIEGNGFRDLISVLTSLSDQLVRVYDSDLSFTSILLNEFEKTEVVANTINENQIIRFQIENVEFCSAKEFCGMSIKDWGKELGVKGSLAQIISHGIGKALEESYRKNLYFLPRTRIGYVRKELNKLDLYKEYKTLYHQNMEQYRLYAELSRGGLVGYNPGWFDLEERVWAYDIKSSYPYEMLAQEYPVGKMIIKNSVWDLRQYRDKLWVARMYFKYIKAKKYDYLGIEGTDCCTLTSLDFEIVKKHYDFKLELIPTLGYYNRKAKLWDSLRKLIFDYFKTKESKPKGSKEYEMAKISLNSIFGLFAQDPLKYDVAGEGLKLQYQKQMRPWVIGNWVAAYGRYDLMRMIEKAKGVGIYWDTDSLKTLVPIDDIIEQENLFRHSKLNLPTNLGSWVCEAENVSFIVFNKKQYFQDGICKCAGLNSELATAYLQENDLKPYAGLTIPPEYTGRTRAIGKHKEKQSFTLGGISEEQIIALYKLMKGEKQ